MNIFTTIWQSIVLGMAQGLTEFLPISSSGHLALLQRVLGFRLGPSMTFISVMLHLGTLISLCIVFFKDILALFKRPLKPLFMLIVATVPAGLVGVLWGDKINELFEGARGLFYLAICFACTAVMLLVCEIVAKRRKKHAPLGWRHAVPMGLAQAVALFPGISRSGSTIVAGTVSGARRENVAKFSFLMSIPVILGSVLVEGLGFIKQPPQLEAGTGGTLSLVLGIVFGVVFAAVSGLFAIKAMLKVIQKANYKWFSLYLVLLSMACFSLDALQIFG